MNKTLWVTTITVLTLFVMFCIGFATYRINNGIKHQGEGAEIIKPGAEANETTGQLEKAPSLGLSLIESGLSEQQIKAAQLTTNWIFVDEHGNGGGYSSDSPHPLQINNYAFYTLHLHSQSGDILFSFSDNYAPQSISIQRWDAAYATGSQDIWNNLDKSEPVEINESIILVNDDGCDYIYEVYAIWEQGSSYYAFQVKSGPK